MRILIQFIIILSIFSCKNLKHGSSLKLIGGKESNNQFSAVVKIESLIGGQQDIANSCTAAKIGAKRFLTASHCIIHLDGPNTGDKIDSYKTGRTIRFRYAYNGETGDYKSVTATIKNAVSTFSFVNAVKSTNGQNKYDVWAMNGSDVAYIDLEEETPEIGEFKIYPDRINVNDKLIILGFGCKYKNDDNVGVKLKYEDAIVHNGLGIMPGLTNPQIEQYNVHNFITPGRDQSSAAASLCEGDSGGPVLAYNETDGKYQIVGVNSGAGDHFNVHSRLNLVEVKNLLRSPSVKGNDSDDATGSNDTMGSTSLSSSSCSDITPPGGYTCQQQRQWGKCGERWMYDGGFCKRTCLRCN